MIYIYILLFIIGSIMGSFYTVIGLRRPLNESIVSPRSHCESCNHTLKWYELIPVVSYVIQAGRCKFCNSKISSIYPIIEVLSGLLFMLSYILFGFSYKMIIMLLLSSLLIIIYVSDFKYFVILDVPLIIFSLLILITKYIFLGYKATLYSLIAGLVMFLIMYLIKLFGDKVFKRESLGGGDIKLAFLMGIVLNFKLALVSLVFSSFIALPYAIYLIISKKEEMPFGPFLITSLLFVFVFADTISNVLKIFYL